MLWEKQLRNTANLQNIRECPEWIKLQAQQNPPVEYCYNAVQYNAKFYARLHWPMENINQNLNSQKTLHSSPSLATYWGFGRKLTAFQGRYNVHILLGVDSIKNCLRFPVF